jgi:hypothetical protein
VRETIIFGLHTGTIYFTTNGLIKTKKPLLSFKNSTTEMKDCIRTAKISGKWFSDMGDFKTTLALLGVKL